MEVMLAVLSSLKFVEYAFRKWTKALCAHEALRMPQFSMRVNYLLVSLEAVSAARAEHVVQRHPCNAATTQNIIEIKLAIAIVYYFFNEIFFFYS